MYEAILSTNLGNSLHFAIPESYMLQDYQKYLTDSVYSSMYAIRSGVLDVDDGTSRCGQTPSEDKTRVDRGLDVGQKDLIPPQCWKIVAVIDLPLSDEKC